MGKQRIYFIFYPFSLTEIHIYRIFCWKLLHFYFLYEVLLFMKHQYCHWIMSSWNLCVRKIETAEICFRVCCVVLCRSGVTDRETFLPHRLQYLCLLVVTSTMSLRRNSLIVCRKINRETLLLHSCSIFHPLLQQVDGYFAVRLVTDGRWGCLFLILWSPALVLIDK